MFVPEITLKGYQCTRCEHVWVPREDAKPLVCPRCKSPYWDKPLQGDMKKRISWKQKRRMK